VNAYLVTFALAAALSLFVTRLCRDLALRFACVDVPDRARKLHAEPIPAIGGLALFVSAAVAIAVAPAVSGPAAERLLGQGREVATLGALCGAMMLVGLVDDLRPMQWGLKL